MLPEAAARFWANWVNGNQFGIKGPMYDPPNGYHHGQDVPCTAHAPVYALRPGRVVVSAAKPSSVLGYFFAVQVGPGDYDGYCHQMGIPPVGTVVTAGQQVSIAAGPSDPHGSAWTGPHLHFTNGPGAYSVEGLNDVRDPRPIIKSVLAGFAGGGSTPLEEDDMDAEQDARLKNIENMLAVAGQGYGYPQRIEQETSDMQARLYVTDAAGTRLYDNWQWMHNSVVPSLLTAIQAVGGGQQVDVASLLRDSEARLEATFQSQLQAFGASLMADVVTTVEGIKPASGSLTQEDVIDALGTFFDSKFSTAAPAATTQK